MSGGLTINAVNKAIADRGGKEKLVRGIGYYYFVNVGKHGVPSSGVYVQKLNQLTLDQWLQELKEKRAEGESRQ